MGKYVDSKVYIANNELQKQVTLYEYVQNNLDTKLKEKVKPIMRDAKILAGRQIRSQSWSNPNSFYSWKLKIKGTNKYKRQHGRYARSLVVKDHSKPYDVFFEVTGNKKEYRLSHLIEHSHKIKINGKVLPNKTKSINHMYISQELVNDKAPKACEEVIDKLFNI